MKAAVLLILLAVPAFVVGRSRLFDREAAAIDRAFERADVVLRAQASRSSTYSDLVPDGDWAFARLLPVGHWKLLIEAYPDHAFERYSGRINDEFPHGLVARWGIHALAKLRHPPAKALLVGRLDSPDPQVRAHAIRLLGFFMDPSLTPRLLALLPKEVTRGEENELTQAIFDAAGFSRPPDPDALLGAILRYEKDHSGPWFGTETPRSCLAVVTASDPLREAERLLARDPEKHTDDEFEEWLPAWAALQKRADFAPLLRRRVQREIEVQKAEENEKFLDPASAGPLEPQFDAAWGFRGAFVLAAYRKALRDLGVPLTDEERGWLDRHRLLRSPREYLVEAGILPRR